VAGGFYSYESSACHFACHKQCYQSTVDTCAAIRDARELTPVYLMAESDEDKLRWMVTLQRLRIHALGGKVPGSLDGDVA